VVAQLPWATPVWLSGSRVGGRGWVSSVTRPSLSLDLFISLQREKKKSGVLLVCDFLGGQTKPTFCHSRIEVIPLKIMS
jgi:hypothetical protein